MIKSLTAAVTVARNKTNILLPLLFCVLLGCFFVFYYSGAIGKILASANVSSTVWHYFTVITGLVDFSIRAVLFNCAVLLGCLLVELGFLGWDKSSLKRLVRAQTPSSMGDLWCWALSALYLYKLLC